jgi:V/A-type H+-transporting ATPase subunit I
MLFPAKMKEVSIIGLKEEKENVLESIQNFGFLHPKETNLTLKSQQPENEGEIAAISRINRLLEKIDGAMNKKTSFLESFFGPPSTTKKIPNKINLKNIDSIEKSVNKNIDSLRNLEVEIKDLENLNELLLKLKGIKIDFSSIKSSKNTKTFLGEVDIKDIQKILERFDNAIFEIKKFSKDKAFLIIIYHLSESNIIKEINQYILKEYDIKKLTGTPIEQLKKMNKKLNQLKKEYEPTLKKFLIKSKQWKQSLTITRGFLTNLKEKKDIEVYLKNTEKTFILSGWVPEKYSNKLASSLKKFNCWINLEETKEAPILLENPKILKPFESFVRSYGFPQYGFLDPTFFVALALPIFFGFMMSDVIYGVFLLIISLLLKRFLRNKTTEWLSNVAIFCSVFTILFGIIFGSYAGFGFQPIWINPQKKPITMLVTAISIGILQVNIGIILNIINGIKNRDLKKLLDSISWFLIEFSVISGAAGVLGLFKISTNILLPFILGVGIRIFIKKFLGLMDIPSFFGNILSYARLMIIVLTSTYIAFVINLSVQMLWGKFILLAVIIFIFGHTFNFLLSILGASINSVRLHYVEFFGKFFDGNGMEYKPFRKNLIVEVI